MQAGIQLTQPLRKSAWISKKSKNKNPIAIAIGFFYAFCFYSVLSATTGSFLAAILAGNKPAITVSTTLTAIKKTAFSMGR